MTKAYGIKWHGTEVGDMIWFKILHIPTEASMDPRDVELKSPWPSYFMLTCLGIPRHDDKKYVNMST